MKKDNSRELTLVFLLFLSVATPSLAFMLWQQALDFDPCNNIFTKVPSKCMEPGLGAVLAGLIAIGIGLMIMFGGIRSLIKSTSDRIMVSLLSWFGFCMIICGSAYFYIGI